MKKLFAVFTLASLFGTVAFSQQSPPLIKEQPPVRKPPILVDESHPPKPVYHPHQYYRKHKHRHAVRKLYVVKTKND